MLLWWF